MIKMYGEVLLTADFSSTRVFQKFKPSNNMILQGVTTQIIIYNNPTFTSINMKLYANRSGSPAGLIATSTNSLLKAEIHTQAHAWKNVYFDFADFVLKADDTYHLVLSGSGYTGTASSHIAWKHSFPDPAYQTNVDMSLEALAISPFDLTIHGAIL